MKSTQKKKKPTRHFGKEDAKRNTSLLYGQMGLVLALLLVYLAIEAKTPVQESCITLRPDYQTEEVVNIPDTTPEPKKPKIEVGKPIPNVILDTLDIKKNDDAVVETVIDLKTIDPDSKVSLPKIVEVTIPEEDSPDIISYPNIKEAPVYPGCKGDLEAIKKCFSKSITKLVTRKFDGDLAQELNLNPGKKRIIVQFTVDKTGKITHVKVRAPHKRLAKEARRVIGLLPPIKAGKYKGKPVGVRFTLPITLEVK